MGQFPEQFQDLGFRWELMGAGRGHSGPLNLPYPLHRLHPAGSFDWCSEESAEDQRSGFESTLAADCCFVWLPDIRPESGVGVFQQAECWSHRPDFSLMSACSLLPGWMPWCSSSAWRMRSASRRSTITTCASAATVTPQRCPWCWWARKVSGAWAGQLGMCVGGPRSCRHWGMGSLLKAQLHQLGRLGGDGGKGGLPLQTAQDGQRRFRGVSCLRLDHPGHRGEGQRALPCLLQLDSLHKR